MTSLHSLFAGTNGVTALLHHLFGGTATVTYRERGEYVPGTDTQQTSVETVSVPFVVVDPAESTQEAGTGNLLRSAELVGTVAASDLTRVPVVDRDLVTWDGCDYLITRIEKGFVQGTVVVYRLEGKRI